MATTDQEIHVQKELAEFAWNERQKLKINVGLSKRAFMDLYMRGEITLSTVFENLIAEVRTSNGKYTVRVSEDGRDFSNGADMKIGVLKKDGDARRYVISNVANKVGTIYFVGWNWLTHSPNFFAIPKEVYGDPKCGIKIPVCKKTGQRTQGKYNEHAYNTIVEMAMVD